ncbi:equilibrative nucleoside transporter 4 [Anoplophora glabripennis]|uniref:equilibrative nucleoside transporter 4 n=1 Tax=Anoplophora glabripennis TaxID=217634 RepID=UPI0008747A51|nr:equilibrative nucleoside transporter 4 [Anoplophora glabripennis]
MSEEGNDAHGYAKLGRSRRDTNDYHTRGAFINFSPPIDAYNAVYLAFVLGGAGFLLPYNSFIMAMDYFKVRYPGTPVVFDMSLVYIAVALATVLGNNLLVETFSLNSRINFGYIISFLTLMFVVLCEVWWEAFGSATSYTVNLAAVAVVAVGCTVQQSSFYGYTSMLPPKYTQAVMVGESTSGVFTSMVRVLTRFFIKELRGSTIYFFTVSVSSVTTCFATYHLIRRTDFIQFYIALCERAKTRITLEPTEDAGLIETNDSQYGVLKIQNSPPPTGNALSFANPAYEPSAPVPTYKVEDVVIRGRQSVSNNGVGLSSIKRGIQARWEVTKAIYPYMISICLVYFATLCLYPGIASEVISCHLGSWMPILMMALFNGADLLGKMLASSARYWTGARLVRCSVARLIMIPLMIMCVAPRANPIFSAEITAFTFSIFLGLTNGVLGSVPMIQAPTKVEDRHRELTGNMMTLLYMFGLAAGSLVAYSLENILSPVQEHPCAPSTNPLQSKIDITSNATADILNNAPSTNLINILSSYIMSTVVELNTTDINK